MSYALARSSGTRRGSLLGLVVGAHLLVLLAIVASKTVVPQIIEMPMVIDLLPPPAVIEKPAPAKPQPVVKPQPVARPRPAAATPAPVIEATQSAVPAPAAPLAAPPEIKPAAPAAPAAEPVSQARFDADYLRNPAPPYPPLARRMGEEGKVMLRVAVNALGSADSVEIKTSSGSNRLDEAARKTVLNWKFIPAKRGETAIASWVLVPIIFKLEQ